ncbi:MAG: cbb3-type cytochrome oxidase assembly protein CcoS, partial [SAR324 cluster bacterium]|nr:cbb3-type cytochrome oxidase assembly protein CcoS [SAR324 cluster bacterium]
MSLLHFSKKLQFKKRTAVESAFEETRNMSMFFVLLPLSIILVGGALVLFLWALRNGQFDDLETPAHRILFEDEQVTEQHHLLGA